MSAEDLPSRQRTYWLPIAVMVAILGTAAYWICHAWHYDGLCEVCLFPFVYSHRETHKSLEGYLYEGSSPLRQIAVAQFDFKDNDRDYNGKHDFWRADIAGLYALIPASFPHNLPDSPGLKRTSFAIKLIELSVAEADDLPVSDLTPFPFSLPRAKDGYRFRALRHEDESVLSPDRFAVCMFPDYPTHRKYSMIIDERKVVYFKDLGSQRGPEVFPLDPIKAGWRKLDP